MSNFQSYLMHVCLVRTSCCIIIVFFLLPPLSKYKTTAWKDIYRWDGQLMGKFCWCNSPFGSSRKPTFWNDVWVRERIKKTWFTKCSLWPIVAEAMSRNYLCLSGKEEKEWKENKKKRRKKNWNDLFIGHLFWRIDGNGKLK